MGAGRGDSGAPVKIRSRPFDPALELPAVDLCGLPVAPVRRDRLEEVVLSNLDRGFGGWIVTANLDIHRQCVESNTSAQLVQAADIVVGDGMPLVWASRLAGRPLPERVAGSDLIWTLSRKAGRSGRSIYLLGGRPDSARCAAEGLEARCPGLQIAGWDCPPNGFDRDDQVVAGVLERVRDAQPDIIYVGLGFPKQDRLIEKIRVVVPGCWCVGIGAGIDLAGGNARRAPRWMQRLGFEWLYRFAHEPGRLGRRYFVDGIPHAVRLFRWALRRRLATSGGSRGSAG